MQKAHKILVSVFFLGLAIALNLQTGFAQKRKNNDIILSLSLSELPNTIQVLGTDVHPSKFSKTLKVSAQGITQYQGNNVNYTINLTLPNFDFNDGQAKTYTNEPNHFFDANKDAAFTLNLGSTKFGNLYRSKEKENILSKVATTDYQITTTNMKDKNCYFILIRIKSGSVLQESSETKSKSQEAVLHIAETPESLIKIINPQPSLPKVEHYKFKSSSEVYKPAGIVN
ncbi:hypothetical protein SAMN05192529_101184 [Arachidicoccus rhizosphaerae]|uniref:Uncharacterized protein n=1 Tax=Arachidicoccus rhizosphaerae TaxID=551991 RepID=A0A1H3VIU0_9BACT|nr:hypothetical protein [Arachidicoccus rhizosphaerae]SDZ74707.1 hypothetical protein SAMN05192529_101184 [Arachidicoccus rhizosphaerae]